MAKNITLLGASYSDVPAVILPKTGGGTAQFVDIDDTTAVETDALDGKEFYKANGEKVSGSIQSASGQTVTPSRSQQTISVSGKYMTGNITVDAIPASYYTLQEVYPVGSLYATETSTDNPATILGFGTWTKYAPMDMTWNDTELSWNTSVGTTEGIYVWKRTA